MAPTEPQEGTTRIGVGVVVFRGGEALIVRRAKPPFVGEWSIPGGGLAYGERLEDCARREVREETGIEIRIGGLIGVFEAPPAPGFPHTVLIDYWADWIAGEPVAGDDADRATFVPLAEALRRVAWDETRRAIEAAAELRDTVIERP